MPHKLLSPLALALALLVVSGFAFSGAGNRPSAGEAVSAEALDSAPPTHTLKIDYERGNGSMRRAQLTLQPNAASAAPLWFGELGSIHVLTKGKGWIIIDSFQSRRGGIQARAMLPPADQLVAVLFRPLRGSGIAWRFSPDARGYTEVEWTFYNQQGQVTGQADDPPAEPDPEAPVDPEDPEVPKDPADPPGDEPDCSAPPCSGIVDPWTCECHPDIRDPWETALGGGDVILSI